MGGQNVAWFISNAAGISDRAHKVGVFLCMHARDISSRSETAGEYRRGARFACEILYPKTDFNSARRTYYRALDELVAAGLVERTGTHGGSRAGNYQWVRIMTK